MAISTYKIFLMKKGDSGSTYEKLIDIKEFPDLGGAPEMLETTTLSDNMQTYIPGVQSLDALEFTANYTKADFTKLKALEGQETEFAVWFGGTGEGGTLTPTGSDGKFEFTGQLSVFPVGGGVNEVVDMTITIAPSTPITVGADACGETANVTIEIDDDSAFTSVTITCVDETNGQYTKTATLTKTQKTTSFTVAIGHTYHIEYGAADGYSKPDNTTSKVSVAGAVSNYEATYYYFTATINVTYPSGATLTCSYGSTVYTATTTTGSYQFKVHEVGTWVIKAVQGSEEVSTSVSITTDGQSESVELSFVKIYGISRNVTSSSPAWARTDDAVGLTATASVGTTAGSSDFDNCAPWSGMTRETLSTGDVMVKIPKFWYRRYKEGDIEYIKIADKATTGFTLHPLFNHAGVESDCAYVGAYKTSSNNKSVSGASPQESQTRATFRSNAKAKGTGWSLIDIAAVSAIQMLCMVEFATTNAQAAIGRGYCDSNSAALSTGSCNNVANLTGRPAGTDGKTGVVYRGIEDFWGNVWEWVDGVNWNGGTYYVCNNPANYADDTATNYTALSYKGATNWSSSYITTEGLDTGNNPHVMLPSAAGSGSESTYYCDACWSSTGWKVFRHGGVWFYGSACGLFTAGLSSASSYSSTGIGSRLLYIPS